MHSLFREYQASLLLFFNNQHQLNDLRLNCLTFIFISNYKPLYISLMYWLNVTDTQRSITFPSRPRACLLSGLWLLKCMVYTNSAHLSSVRALLSMKTSRLLWLHTTFKWTALQGLPESTGLQGFRLRAKQRKIQQVEASVSVSKCLFCFCRLAHVSLKAARISKSETNV